MRRCAPLAALLLSVPRTTVALLGLAGRRLCHALDVHGTSLDVRAP